MKFGLSNVWSTGQKSARKEVKQMAWLIIVMRFVYYSSQKSTVWWQPKKKKTLGSNKIFKSKLKTLTCTSSCVIINWRAALSPLSVQAVFQWSVEISGSGVKAVLWLVPVCFNSVYSSEENWKKPMYKPPPTPLNASYIEFSWLCCQMLLCFKFYG